MKKIILIRGPICAGKSTIVQILKNSLAKSSLIDVDAFKRAIDHTKASKWRTKLAFDTSLFLAKNLMQKKRTIIADIHSGKDYQYKEYKKLAVKYNYKLYSYLLYPPLEVCLDRNKKRAIPGVKYKISRSEIIDHWKNPYRVKGELVFDSSIQKPKEISNIILKDIK